MSSSSYTWTAPDVSSRPITVIGGGVLGRRLCLMWASTGKTVFLSERSPEVATAAITYIKENLANQASRTDIPPRTVTIADTLEDAVKDSWLVIECIPEILDLKIPLFGELDRITKPDCILATNSSSYKSSEMIEQVTNRYRVCNAHAYMPPTQNCLEIMSCGHTEPAIISLMLEQSASVGFIPVHARVESTGFIFNRVWAAIKREALLVLAEGVAEPSEVDAMFKNCLGSAIGPCQLMDQVGLDTVYNIESHYVAERGIDATPMEWLKANYLDKNWLGRKSGKGLTGSY